jgi:proline iminopeptidase
MNLPLNTFHPSFWSVLGSFCVEFCRKINTKIMNKKSITFLMIGTLIYGILGCEQGGLDPNKAGLLVPKTVVDNPALPSIKINGVLLHSEAFGNPNNPILLVLHGGPGGDYRYLLNCKKFVEDGFYVVFYDQRGSGLSQRLNKETYRINQMEEEVGGVINYYRKSPNQKVFILGHSWGGMLATAFINSNLTKVNGAIIAEPGGLIWQDVKDYVSRSNKFDLTSETLNDVIYQDQFLTSEEDQHEILDYKYTFFSAAEKNSPVGNDGAAPYWRNGAVIFRALLELGDKEKPNWTTNLSQFKTKILFVYSQNNTAYGEVHAKKVSSAYPNVQLELTKDAGHNMITFDKGWQNFYPAARTYLNALK